MGVGTILISLVIGSESALSSGKFSLIAAVIFVAMLVIWVAIFNRNPKLPYYFVDLNKNSLIIGKLADTQEVRWNTIGSVDLSKFRCKLLIQDTQKTKIAEIFLYVFNKQQRAEIIKQVRLYSG